MGTYQVSRNCTLEELDRLEKGGYKVEAPENLPPTIPPTIKDISGWAKAQPDNINIRFSPYNIYPGVRKIMVEVHQVHPDADTLAPGPVLEQF